MSSWPSQEWALAPPPPPPPAATAANPPPFPPAAAAAAAAAAAITPPSRLATAVAAAAVAAAAAAAVALPRFRAARAHEVLVRSGLGVQGVELGRAFFAWPFQSVEAIDLSAVSLRLSVACMSAEKMPLQVPFVFTVGPHAEQPAALERYARLMLHQSEAARASAVAGVVEGEARMLAAGLPVEELFAGRAAFKAAVTKSVQSGLDRFGMLVHNANIEELRDAPGSTYFKTLSQRISAQAENTAKIEVAEQTQRGSVGAAEREAATRQRLAEVEAEARRVENDRDQLVLALNAATERVRAETGLVAGRAKIEAAAAARQLEADRDREVQQAFAARETERLRGELLSRARAEGDAKVSEAEASAAAAGRDAEGAAAAQIKSAEGSAAAARLAADAALNNTLKQAEGNAAASRFATDAALHDTLKRAEGDAASARFAADAALHATLRKAEGAAEAARLAADAALHAKLREAEGDERAYAVRREGLAGLVSAFGGDMRALVGYTMLDRGTHVALADANAKAIAGLQPKISVWTADASQAMEPVRRLASALPPVLDTLADQAGYRLPEWLLQSPPKPPASAAPALATRAVAVPAEAVAASAVEQRLK
jgi:flotillin